MTWRSLTIKYIEEIGLKKMPLTDRSCAMLKQTFKDHEVNTATSVNGDQSEFKTLDLFLSLSLSHYHTKCNFSLFVPQKEINHRHEGSDFYLSF